jgi:hypothetical protein
MIALMSEFTKALLIASVHRYLLICAGIAFACMGYRLFKLGYFEKAGELKAAFGEHHVLVKQVAPGVFFAALGVLTILTGVVRSVEVSVPAIIVSRQGAAEALTGDSLKPCDDSLLEEYRGEGGPVPKQKK